MGSVDVIFLYQEKKKLFISQGLDLCLPGNLKRENPCFSTLHDLAWVHTHKHKLGLHVEEVNYTYSHACDQIHINFHSAWLALCMYKHLKFKCGTSHFVSAVVYKVDSAGLRDHHCSFPKQLNREINLIPFI